MTPREDLAVSWLGISGVFAASIAVVMLITSTIIYGVYIALGFAAFNLTLSVGLSFWYERKGSR